MTTPTSATLSALPPFKPDLCQRAWASIPHPTLPLLATPHATSVTVFSLATLSKHSALTGGHSRSVRHAAWQPGLRPGRLRLVTGSFDSTAGLWSYNSEKPGGQSLEREITSSDRTGEGEEEEEEEDWEFNLVLEGHENEIKSVAFSPSGQYLATSSRDKSVWIWEDVGAAAGGDDEDDGGEWETVAVLSEHEGDVKAVAWCPDVPGREKRGGYSSDVLASASYDDTVRIWREDGDGEWVCVAVLEGHGGTVWGIHWEPKPKGEAFPRLLTHSADGEIRLWTLKVEEGEEERAPAGGFRSAWGGIPNTMRRELREEWGCTAVLPKVHTRDIYSVAWSAESGILASTGSDGVIALFSEGPTGEEDVQMTSPGPEQPNGTNGTATVGTNGWRVLGTVADAHGPYEINHITWCKRFDAGTAHKGEEEMLVTTGDDGVIRPWEIRVS